jgi:hypothetical protein
VMDFFQNRVLQFAWAGFKPRSSWSLLPE